MMTNGTAVRLSLFLAMVLAVSSPCVAADTYLRAQVDETGQLRILTKAGKTIVLKKEAEQVGFDKIQISPDGHAVGWLALYPFCCTSYPIPLKLCVYSGGHLRSFTGQGLPVWHWHFMMNSRRFAFEQETVHGSLNVHYELVDVASGWTVAEFTPDVDERGQVLPVQVNPDWVNELNASR
jgi:hypothetical protein